MRKLELKDIVGYLPYDLHIMRRAWDEEEEVAVFEEVTSDWIIKYITFDYLIHERCKPILHPMSDLTKSIVVKGYNDDKEFVPLEVLSYTMFGAVGLIIDQKMCFGYRNRDTFYWDENDFTVNYHDSDDYINVSFLKVYDLLNQWHFDYRNLIEEGLAIDINTLNQTDKIWK